MNGTIALLKPPGITSHSAVAEVRRLLGVRKAGHAGTLDPGAAGLLIVCVGRATKLTPYLMAETKEYVAELTIGEATDTLDSYGKVVSRSGRVLQRAEVLGSISHFTGAHLQRVPAFSAIKVNGRALYRYAREGVHADRPVRPVRIDELQLLDGPEWGPFRFRVRCSKGSYVRVLLTDIAAHLGSSGYVSFLERTACGSRSVNSAHTFGEIAEAFSYGATDSFLTAPEDSLDLPRIFLPSYLYDILLSGAAIDTARVPGLVVPRGNAFRLFCRDTFFGVCELRGGHLKITARIKLQSENFGDS